jgi:hypothetical protein
VTLEELSEEQWKMMNAPLKQKDGLNDNRLINFGLKEDKIPPCVFPKKPYIQKVITDE